MAKIYLFFILVSLLGGVGYGGYSYYLWSQETMNTLRENNVKLKAAAETLQNTVNTMKADAEKNEKLKLALRMTCDAISSLMWCSCCLSLWSLKSWSIPSIHIVS